MGAQCLIVKWEPSACEERGEDDISPSSQAPLNLSEGYSYLQPIGRRLDRPDAVRLSAIAVCSALHFALNPGTPMRALAAINGFSALASGYAAVHAAQRFEAIPIARPLVITMAKAEC